MRQSGAAVRAVAAALILLCHGALALRVRMGLEVTVKIAGNRKAGALQWTEDACRLYEERLRGNIDLRTTWFKGDAELAASVQKDRGTGRLQVCLDPRGKQYTSEDFSEQLYKWLEDGGSRLSFVIGGAEGLPQEVRDLYLPTVSFGKLTMTHQMARVLLSEQVYRGSQIRLGTKYHK